MISAKTIISELNFNSSLFNSFLPTSSYSFNFKVVRATDYGLPQSIITSNFFLLFFKNIVSAGKGPFT